MTMMVLVYLDFLALKEVVYERDGDAERFF